MGMCNRETEFKAEDWGANSEWRSMRCMRCELRVMLMLIWFVLFELFIWFVCYGADVLECGRQTG